MNKFLTEKITLSTHAFPRIIAAPMDGITDSPMRQMIRKFSPEELLYGEMKHISLVANEPTQRSLVYQPIEQPLAFQFSGNSVNFLEKAVERVVARNFVQLNLNSACPARCVIKSGSGSALMANIPLLEEILVALKKTLNGRIPLTIKIRAGFKEKNALEIAQRAQDLGCEMIIIHPRTQAGGFSAPLDFDLVKQIKQTCTVPIVFSGELKSFDDIKVAYERTGVDGFMIGRALWGCPWKMRAIQAEILNQDFTVSRKEAIKYALEHLDLMLAHYGNHGFTPFKKHLPQYVSAIPGAAQVRVGLLRSQTAEEMREKLVQLLEAL